MYFYSILFPCANNYEDLSLQIQKKTLNSFQLSKIYSSNVSFSGIYFMVRHIDISSLLIRSKHCENESGDCIYPGRLYVSYHDAYTHLAVFLKYYTVFGEDEPRGFRRSKPKILL